MLCFAILLCNIDEGITPIVVALQAWPSFHLPYPLAKLAQQSSEMTAMHKTQLSRVGVSVARGNSGVELIPANHKLVARKYQVSILAF